MTSFFMRLSKSWDCALLFSSHQDRASQAPTAHCLLAAFHFLISSSSSTHEIFTGFIIFKKLFNFKFHFQLVIRLSRNQAVIRQFCHHAAVWLLSLIVVRQSPWQSPWQSSGQSPGQLPEQSLGQSPGQSPGSRSATRQSGSRRTTAPVFRGWAGASKRARRRQQLLWRWRSGCFLISIKFKLLIRYGFNNLLYVQ